MVGGNWLNEDKLFLKYGTDKAVPTTAGDYLSYGGTSEIEFTLIPANLTTTASIVADTVFFPSNVFIESVTTDVDVTTAGGTSLSIGTMSTDRTTSISDTTFLSAAPIADHTTAGQKKEYTNGVTGAGTGIGTVTSFTDNGVYISAKVAGTYTGAGQVKVRIRYRGYGTITH